MAENPQGPLLDRSDLEKQFGDFVPSGAPEPLPNIPFRGPRNPMPSGGGEQRVSAVEALDASIRKPIGQMRGGSVMRSLGEMTNPRFDSFVPGDYNNEDAYAQGQGWTEKMVNGVGKGLVLTGTTFLQSTVGLANGLVNYIATGNFSSFYNNEMNRNLDNLNKELDDNLLPNYYTDVEKNAKWYSPDNLFTANFVFNSVIKNLGFAAGAALSGGVYAAGIRALSSLPGISRLISIGKQAEVLAATEASLLSANKAADTYGKVKSLSDRFLSAYNVLSPGGRTVVAGLSTVGEAGFEALQNLNEERNKLIEDYMVKNDGLYPQGEAMNAINRKADEIGNSTFRANVALLTATNYIQFPKILGSSYNAEKGMINSLVSQTDEIVEQAGKYVAKPAFGGKILGTLNKIRPYTFSTSEAFEEGAQYAIGVGVKDYYDKKNNNDATSFLTSLSEGISQTFGTDEGMENILIGGLSGAIMQAKGTYQENKEKAKNTADAIQKFNQYRLSNFSKDTIDSVNRGTVLQQEREELLKKGDVLNSKDKEADYVINYLSPRIKYGRFDLVKADIDEYRMLASTEKGFAQLVAEGKALATDTREAFLARVGNLEQTANNVKSLYQSLNLRYNGLIDADGKPIYEPATIDKMVYAASKVADYDVRIPKLSPKLAAAGINVDEVVSDIIEGKVESFNSAIDSISNRKDLTDDQKEEIGQALEDVAEMSIRRDKFLKEYNDIKKSPEKHKEYTPTLEEESEDTTPKEKIKVKTKTGEKTVTSGEEYILGKSFDYDKDGLEIPISINSITILGENEDGTIKIKDSNGEVKDISKDKLDEYKLSKLSDAKNDKTLNYFINNRNEIFEYNFGKQYGGKKSGRLEYDGEKLSFVYKDDKGKIRRKKIDSTHFVAQEGYDQPRIKSVGKVETAEQKIAREEFTSAEEIAKQKETLAKNKDARLEIITQIETETRERLAEVNKKLETKKAQLDSIQKDLDKIGDEVKVAEPRTKRDKALEAKYPELSRQKARFGKVFAATSRAISKLFAMREDVNYEIAKLTAEKNELEFNLQYFEDFSQNLDELPENSGEFLKELKEQVGWLNELVKDTGEQINALAKLAKKIESAIKDFVSLLQSSMQKFDSDYPDYIRDTFEKIKDNPTFSDGKTLKDYLADYAMLEDLQKEISVNENQLDSVNDSVADLYKQLEDLGNQYNAKKQILDRFQGVADAYTKRKLEEEKLAKDEKLIAAALGTADESVQTAEFNEDYEPVARKSDEIITRATVGVMRNREHQERANRFGFNLEKFDNRNEIRGVYITSKNENELIPGLTDFLRTDDQGNVNDEVKRDEIIALVMVIEDSEGKPVLVGEDGKPISEGVDPLSAAIFQVFPDSGLRWSSEFNGDSMFRNAKDEERQPLIQSLTKQYKKWRDSVIANPTLEPHEIAASFGRAQNVTDGDGNIIYETRTSVQDAGLVSADEIEANQVINIPTLPTEDDNFAVVSKGTTSYRVPVGTVLLETKEGIAKLQNRQHTEKEAETIYKTILQLAKYMLDPEVGISDPKSERLLTWLKSVVYWGLPEDQEGNRKPAGYNSIFFERNTETGKMMLTLSGKGMDIPFTPTYLEENKDSVVLLISNMYNNISSYMSKNLNESYEQILDVSESGEVKSLSWPNYQSYLLSSKTPDGKTRSGEELPLSTTIKPLVGENDVNRTDIYFYTTDTADDFVIPVVEKKKVITPKVLKPGAPTEPSTVKTAKTEAAKPADVSEKKFILDNETPNEIVSKTGKKFMFIAPSNITAENFMKAIKILKGGDLADIEKVLKEKGEDVGVVLKNIVFNAIKPYLSEDSDTLSIPEEGFEEDESVIIAEDENSITIIEDEDAVVLPEETQKEVVTKVEAATGKPVSKSVLAAINKKRRASSGQALREKIKQDIKSFIPENWTDVENWLNTNFPNIPVYRVKNIIQATNGKQAWGMFKDGAIYIYENAEVGTVYHEVFHAVWRMFSDPTEQKAVLDELKNRSGSFFDRSSLDNIKYSEATNEQLEEKLAEEFRDYVQFKKIPAKPTKGRPFILKLFADMVTAIKSLFLKSDSASKVEEMFKNINQGKYKSIPYQSSLAFATKGVIDVENALADEDAVLSVMGLSDKQMSEIIQHMTWSLLTNMISTDKSLFEVEKQTKSTVYKKLKSDLLQTVAQEIDIIQEMIDNEEFAEKEKEEAKSRIASVVQLMQTIEDEWVKIVEKHEMRLKSYQIEFDENDNIQLNDENNSGRSDYQDATKIDSFKKANSAIKLLLATIPIADDEGRYVPSPEIGGAQLLPVGKTFISLMNNLHSATSVEDMIEKLRQMAENDVNYRALFRRITKRNWNDKGVDLSKINTQHGLQLLSAFWSTFKKQNPEVRNVFILENGDIVVGEANLSTAAQQLRSNYINSIVTKAKGKGGFFKYDEKQKAYVGDPSKLKEFDLSTNAKVVKFLDELEIPFTMKEVNRMNSSQLKRFRTAAAGVKESILKAEKISTFTARSLNINKRLFEIALIKTAVSNPEFSSTYFNVAGERTQSYIGTNAASNLYNFLSTISKFDKATVANGPFGYLVTDSFAKYSNLLSRMFTENGTRKDGTEDLFKIGYVSGSINEAKGKSKESSKLNYKERLVQELNLNLNGWYLNLIPGDASIEWMINMGNPISVKSLNKGMTDINEIFKGYFLSELELSRDDRFVAKNRDNKDLRFFKSILGDSLHNDIINATGTPDKVYEAFEEKINSALKKFIEKQNRDLEIVLRRYGIMKEGLEGLEFENVDIPTGLTQKNLDIHMTVLTVNYMIANIEMHKLLYSDPYQYEDELKRIKNFNSPRQAIISDSPKMNVALSGVWNEGYESGDIGHTKFTQDYFRSATHKDVIGIVDLPGYSDYKETDGSGIISMKANRHFRIRAGQWNSDEERQYKYDVAWEKNDKGLKISPAEKAILAAGNPGIKSAYTPLKPIVSGSKLDAKGRPSKFNNIVLDKFALYPLSYRIMKSINSDSNAIALYNKMQQEDIDYIVFDSGRKVGAVDSHPTYDDKGNFNNAPYSDKNISNIPFSIMSIQAEVPSKDEAIVTRGSQITKLITLDFLEAGVPVDYILKDKNGKEIEDFNKRYEAWYKLSDDEKLSVSELYKEIKNNQDLLEGLIEHGYKSTLSRLGIEETVRRNKDGKIVERSYQVIDLSKAGNTLRDEILKREVNDNTIAALEGFLNGKVVLEATQAYQQVRNIIYSIADKEFISPKISGGMKVQIPSTFLESNRVAISEINGKKGYTSDVLKFYEKDGKRVAEVMLGRWFDSDMTDDELLDYLNNTEEGQKILSGVGYRIPTQKQNSIDTIVIKKFLPKEFGDSVVIPSALVQKVGSDFDIDKLSVYLKNVHIKNGKPKLIPYFGIGEQAIAKFGELYDKGEFLTDEEMKELDRFIAEEMLLLEDVAAESKGAKLMASIVGKLLSEQELTEEFTKGIPAKDQIINKLYKKSLENEYIQSMENLITHPKNYDNLIKPNSADSLKDLATYIAEKTVGQSFDYKNVGNMLDRTFMSRLRHAFVTGKYAIGIAAVNQTNHSLNQRQPIYIDKNKMELVSNEDKFWLTSNPDIKFKEYNTIQVDGRTVPTLSMITNKAGEVISDIIGMFIDGYVDISKGPWIMELGATPNVASTWLFLVKLGVPIKSVAYFMNQPIIRDYLRSIESAGYSWLFMDSFVNFQDRLYEDDPIHPTTFDQMLSQFKIPSEITLKNNLGKNIGELNKQQKLEQRFMLREFLKYAKMAEHMFHVTQGSNYDTANFNDPFLVFKKQMQQIKAQNTIINSVDTLLSNSFVGNLAGKIVNIRNAFAQIITSDSLKVRNVIQNVLLPYINVSDRDFVKLAQKATTDLFDWAVQIDQNLNKEIADILINDGGVAKELLTFVNDVKEDSEHELYGNQVIEIIQPMLSSRAKTGGPNNIKLNLGENKVYDQNNIIYAFRQLKEYLEGENSSLYDRIVSLAVLQSGLSGSPISFTSLIPYEDFEKIYNKTLSKLEGMSNLQDFFRLGVFQRNNWNNDDIVPYAKAAWIESKKTEKRYYNPSMKFLPDAVHDAVNRNEIPPVLTRSKRNREANSDYIVYTWEKQEEVLTDQEVKYARENNKALWQVAKDKKAVMKKAGDYSYINKGLFKKVYDDYGVPIEHTDYNGNKYFVYKAINAWGDSFRANEFWPTDHKSVIDNGFIKVEDVDNNLIISKFLKDAKVSPKPVSEKKIDNGAVVNALNKTNVINKKCN
jgi:uncharacterized protein (DUF2267 family)